MTLEQQIGQYTQEYTITRPEHCKGLKEPHVFLTFESASVKIEFDGPVRVALKVMEAATS